MLRWIVQSSLQLRLMVVAIAGIVIFLGITQLRDVPVDVFPEFEPPYVEIQTEALGLSAAEVEELITVPLEAKLLNGVAWVDDMRSESIPGLSSIVLIFEPGTDVMRARQMVQERLTQAHSLPNVSKPPAMLQPLSSTSRVMKVGMTSDRLSHIDMSVLARWTIRPRLMGIPGVANVAIWGQRKRQLQVQVDPERLRAEDVTLLQIIKSTGNALWVSPLSFLNASTPGTGGWIDTPNQRLGIRHVLPIRTPDDLAQVAVEGTSMRLGDIAEVVEEHQPLIGDAVIDDGAGLLLVVEKFPWANTLEVTSDVEAALADLQPGLGGIVFDSEIFRPATYIETAIDNLTLALLIGMVLVIAALFAFFFSWRAALISLVSIPLSLLAALFVLYLRGATVDAMILAGLVIALGVVVDDAIIDVENVMQRLRQHRADGSNRPLLRVILDASLEMRGAIVYATLIIVLAVVPVFFMGGLSGAFFKPLAFSYVLAVLVSMVVALTVTPALSMLLFRSDSLERGVSPLVAVLHRAFDAVLAPTIRKPVPAYIVVAVVAVAGLAVIPFMGQELLPSFKENNLLIKWEGTPGTSHPAMNRIVKQASEEIRTIPGVRNVGAHAGRAVLSDEIVGINASELWVSVDPAADYDRTVDQIRTVVDGYPGLSRDVLTYGQERIREALTGGDEALVVRIYGKDLDVLRAKADEVEQMLAGIDGVVNPAVEFQVEEPVVEIQVNLTTAEEYGIKPGDVRRAAATLVQGIEVGNLFEEQKVFDVIVVGVPSMRHSLTSVRELLIDRPGGGHVRLEEVADVRVVPSPNVIKREGVSRRIDVGANVRGRNPAAIARDVEQGLKTIDFPLEYHAELLGEYAERQTAQARLFGFALAALIGIFLLLQAAFGSWRLATLVFLGLPMALIGGLLAAFFGGGILTIGSLVGLVAVFGIAARNAILLVHRYQQLEREGSEPFGPELILRGTRERFAPIVMTAVTTGVAILPLVFFGAVPGFEIVHPMAVVILGGLITSTLLSLHVLPALYLQFGDGTLPEILFPEEAIRAAVVAGNGAPVLEQESLNV